MLVGGAICAQLLRCKITLHQSSGLLAHKFLPCLLLRQADPCKLARSKQGSMISDSTEKRCLCVNTSGAEDRFDGLPTLCHLAHRWRAHGAIGVQRQWIHCCSNVGDNLESAGDDGHGGGTVSSGNGSGVHGGGNGWRRQWRWCRWWPRSRANKASS